MNMLVFVKPMCNQKRISEKSTNVRTAKRKKVVHEHSALMDKA